jgi:general secretion pathway protein L
MNAATARAGAQPRLLVLLPPRRSLPGGARGAPGAAAPVSYLALAADGTATAGSAPVARLPRARSIDLVFDCRDVFSATIDAPRLGEARLRQALPNLLEERMLSDPADCHFASSPARAEESLLPAAAGAGDAAAGMRLSVAAIDRATLGRALEPFQQAGLPVRAAYSEIYTLTRPRNGTFCLRVENGRGVLRTGLDEGCSFELADGASETLALARRQFGIARLRVYGDPAGVHLDAVRALAAPLDITVEATDRRIDPSAIADAVNLLQGAYASASGTGLAGRLLARLARDGAWKAPAAWAGICAAIGLGGLNAYWFKLQAQYGDLNASMQHAFRDAFPSEPTIVDALAQAQRQVAGLRARVGRPSANDFSVLNAQALQLFESAPVGVVAAIDYTDAGYSVRFTPGAMDSAALRNTLQARALAQGLALRFAADGSATLAPMSEGAGR